jgi:hypothetical protein
LEGGPPGFTRSSTSSVLLWNADNNAGLSLLHTGLSPSVVDLSRPFCWRCLCNCLSAPATPSTYFEQKSTTGFQPVGCRDTGKMPVLRSAAQNRCWVWAIPLSLAATNGVSVDFLSCRYLDVSVPCVGSGRTMHSSGGEGNWLPSANGFPHWEVPGLTVAWHLPRAYRSLPRPSSPLDAKTSPIHP